MYNIYGLIMIIMNFINAISQVMLKRSANETKDVPFLKKFLNKNVFFAYVLFVIVTIGNLIAYRGVDFKYGGIITSIGQLFVLILSIKYCDEKLTTNRFFGSLLIIGGIIVYSLK